MPAVTPPTPAATAPRSWPWCPRGPWACPGAAGTRSASLVFRRASRSWTFGCGGGIDVTLAAYAVGAAGRVVGVDAAPQMIEKARQNLVEAGLGAPRVEVRVADLADTGLAAGCADVVISNGVLNLCPDKDAAYREAFRILRPGGRLAISDMMWTEELAPELQACFQSTWAGCVSGALPAGRHFATVRRAGFERIAVVGEHRLSADEVAEMACCPGPAFTPRPAQGDLDAVRGKLTSIKFSACKPR